MSILPDERLRSVSTASLTDALGRLVDHRAHVLDLVSPTPGRVLFGEAATIRFVPFRSDLFDESRHSFARHFYDAVPAHPSGTVLVLDSSGHPDVSVGGGTKFSRLQNLGMAGLITDARLRDFDDLRHYKPGVLLPRRDGARRHRDTHADRRERSRRPRRDDGRAR